MPILMEEPLKYMLDPNVRRFGAILKNINTGQIVGHVKETGEMGKLLSNLPALAGFNPLSVAVDVLDRGIKTYQISNVQKTVDQIQQTLEGMQLATNIAAWSSVANLGVSVAGFAVVTQKLNRIDSKIDGMVDDLEIIKQALKSLDQNWESMTTAKLQRAAEDILVSERADSADMKLDKLKRASESFSLLRHYYSNLLRTEGLFDDVGLTIENLNELISRYTFCCMGLLHAEFSIGDLGSYGKYVETIDQEYRELVCFSPQELYLARSDRLGVLAIEHDHRAHSKSLQELSAYSNESANRVDSFQVELDYIKGNSLTVEGYLKALRDFQTDLVLLPR